jgi:hypothetical protein
MTDEQARDIKRGILALLAVAIQIRDDRKMSTDQAIDKAEIFLETLNQKIAEENRE